jgi:proteasome accessory factor A
MMACKQYSEIGAERSLFYKRQRAGLVDRTTDDDAIKRAIYEPPEDTRAKLRRNLCDTFNIEMIDWSLLVVNDGTRRRIDLLDPYATKLEEAYGPTAS